MAAGGRWGSEPAVDVGLAAGAELTPGPVQCGEEGDDLAEGGSGVVDCRGEVASGVGGAPELGQHPPPKPRLDNAPVGVGAIGQQRGEFVGEPVDQTVRVVRQGTGGDEQGAQVFQVPAGWQRVDRGVGALHAPVVQGGECGAGSGLCQPVQGGFRFAARIASRSRCSAGVVSVGRNRSSARRSAHRWHTTPSSDTVYRHG